MQLDQLATVLLNFPPAAGLADDTQYQAAAQSHSKTLEKLAERPGLREHAAQLLDHVHPTTNSASYLALLIAAHSADSLPTADLLAKVTTFLCTFDARQIRFRGKAFSTVLDWLVDGSLFPASVAVDLLTTALLRLDPTGSVHTSHHLPLVKLAYNTDNITPALPLLKKDIAFYPGAKHQLETRPLAAPDLLPAAYITIESGLTRPLTASDVLQYDLLRALCFIQQRAWRPALAALERVLTYPARDTHSCSKIQTQAHNKWILVGLLADGKLPTLPSTTSVGAQKAFAALGKPYLALGAAFEDRTSAAALRAEFDAVGGASFFAEEGNLALARLVLTHYQRWQIVNLRHVYSTIALKQVRERTQSAETGAPLASEEEVEGLVREMIAEGMLRGKVERPSGGAAGDSGDGSEAGSGAGSGGGAYLVFHDAPDGELSEAEFASRMLVAVNRLRAMQPLVEAADERLAGSRDYIKHLVGQQRMRENRGRGGGDAREHEASSLSNPIEDEDLMMGLVAGQ